MRSSSASPVILLLAAVSLVGLALHYRPVGRGPAPAAPETPPPGPAAAVAPATPPPVVRDDAELARLREELGKLRAELEAARGSLDQNQESLARATRELERLRRPLEVDMSSATLRASLAPGEGVVTGGYRLPDGTRLFAFVETSARPEGGIGVAGHFFAVPDELVQTLGLQTLATEAANTLQHGEVWIRDEMVAVTDTLLSSPGARIITSGGTALQPGVPADLSPPSRPGDPPLSLSVNALFDDRQNLDLELRLESIPAQDKESADASLPPPEAPQP